jgi:molecular chaperone GrpE (heat shock protein)
LEDALRGMGLEFIAQAGAPFDPECMRAVERVSARERKVGVVAEVVKQGYRRNGEKVRTADVKVTAEDPAGA